MTEPLLSFTQAATEHLKESIGGEARIFRLSIKETGCTGLMYVPELLASPDARDIPIDVDDTLTVYLAKDAVDAVRGTKIDYIKVSLGQKQLAYHNPNADSLCGCGESFNLKNKDDEHDDG